MRKISKLAALSPADQSHVIGSNHPYDEVVALLAKPRSEGGFDLKTSRSALCRFATTFHPDPNRLAHELDRLIPLLETHAHDPAVFPDAIRVLLQQHIFAQLAANKPFDTIAKPFRFLFKLEKQRNAQTKTQVDSPRNFPLVCGTIPPQNPCNSAFPANPAKKNFQKDFPENPPHP